MPEKPQGDTPIGALALLGLLGDVADEDLEAFLDVLRDVRETEADRGGELTVENWLSA